MWSAPALAYGGDLVVAPLGDLLLTAEKWDSSRWFLPSNSLPLPESSWPIGRLLPPYYVVVKSAVRLAAALFFATLTPMLSRLLSYLLCLNTVLLRLMSFSCCRMFFFMSSFCFSSMIYCKSESQVRWSILNTLSVTIDFTVFWGKLLIKFQY